MLSAALEPVSCASAPSGLPMIVPTTSVRQASVLLSVSRNFIPDSPLAPMPACSATCGDYTRRSWQHPDEGSAAVAGRSDVCRPQALLVRQCDSRRRRTCGADRTDGGSESITGRAQLHQAGAGICRRDAGQQAACGLRVVQQLQPWRGREPLSIDQHIAVLGIVRMQ